MKPYVDPEGRVARGHDSASMGLAEFVLPRIPPWSRLFHPPSAITPALAAFLATLAPLLPLTAKAQGATEAWMQRYNGPGNSGDSLTSLAVDNGGNVYVTGWTWGGDPAYGGSSGDWATIA